MPSTKANKANENAHENVPDYPTPNVHAMVTRSKAAASNGVRSALANIGNRVKASKPTAVTKKSVVVAMSAVSEMVAVKPDCGGKKTVSHSSGAVSSSASQSSRDHNKPDDMDDNDKNDTGKWEIEPVHLKIIYRNWAQLFSKVANATPLQHAMTEYFVELACVDDSMVHYVPSLLTAAATFMSMKMKSPNQCSDKIWSVNMQSYTKYNLDELRPVIGSIAKIVLSVPAAKQKYSFKSFGSVMENLSKFCDGV